MNDCHVKWSSFLDQYSFTLKYKTGESNKVADGLSRQSSLLAVISMQVAGIDELKTKYETDPYLKLILEKLKGPTSLDQLPYRLHEGCIFKGNQLCTPKGSLREQIMLELHGNGLGSSFGRDKTLAMVIYCYY